MDDATVRQLELKGAIVRLPSGDAGVRVSLHYLKQMLERSRAERRELLKSKLREVAAVLVPRGGSVDEETASVSGQVCEGVLPVRGYEAIKADVEAREFEVHPVFDRQVL